MATKKQIAAAAQVSIAEQLMHINEVTKLCAFAAEARRILNDISVANELDSDVGDLLGKLTTAQNEWIEHEDNLGSVLRRVGNQLQDVIDQVEKAEASNAIRS